MHINVNTGVGRFIPQKNDCLRHKKGLAGLGGPYMKDGEHGDGVGGRHDRPEVEDVEEAERDGDELGEAVHDGRDDEGRDDGAHEGEGENGADVVEKLRGDGNYWLLV